MNRDLPRVYLVRHGETAWSLTGQHTGRTDLPLTERGEQQARELKARLTALSVDRIFSSSLQRARRTAELAMPQSRIEDDDDLMEWDYGAYEGKRTADIELERPGWRLLQDGSPGGETLDAVCARADRVIGRLRAHGEDVVLFSHRELLRILAARWIKLAPLEGRRLLLDTASLSVLGYDHDLSEPVIHSWNGHIALKDGLT
ncbi:MAG: histidine phosphatase family protein [Planctomycetota bacterium]|jgi:broad specificity phosphatase PhoE|nr:histidine phosphatase family protein [Planctomycetota bacterium]